MLQRFLSKAVLTPFVLACLLGSVVIAAPIVNANGRPPRMVFLILPDNTEPPVVTVHAEPLGGGRYRVHLDTTAFQFTEICVAEAQAIPLGHAHVHVNGEKVASAYFPTVDIGPLPPGEHIIDAVLRGQDHRPIVGRDGLAQGLVKVKVPARPV